MFNFNTVYKISLTRSDIEPSTRYVGIGMGFRPMRRTDSEGFIRDGFEWRATSTQYEIRAGFLRIEEASEGRIVTTDVLDEELGYDTKYIFESLTLERFAEIKDSVESYDQIVKFASTDAELQEFYRNDWLPDDWKPRSDPE